ncbi:MAG TPA: hypothetical protein VMI54_14110, partial [Polyangiaceae bacterium]|nr:hypothetical protein [Polyangiaceae bacterium]
MTYLTEHCLPWLVVVLVVSCTELPDTQLKNRGGRGGGNGSSGTGGSTANGGVGHGGSAAASVSSAGSGGSVTAGSSNASAGGGGKGGTGSGGTKGGTPGKGGAGHGAGGSATSEAGAADGGAPEAGNAGANNGAGFSTNRADFFGDSQCKNSNFALCEDFESGALDTATWKPRGAAPSIETVRAARGKYSAHFHTDDDGLSYITQTKTFPAPNDRYYARLFVWFQALPTAPDWAHWTISGAQAGTDTSAPEIRIGGQWDTNDSIELFGVGTDHGTTGDWTNLDSDPNGMPKAVPAQSWVCVEWMFDGSANQTQFWWDGVEHPSL